MGLLLILSQGFTRAQHRNERTALRFLFINCRLRANGYIFQIMWRNDEYYKKVMHTCLCQTVMFKKVSEDELFSILKGVVEILAKQDSLNIDEQKRCLMFFWQDYNRGLQNRMSENYIKEVLIPAVLNHAETDLIWGMTIVHITK